MKNTCTKKSFIELVTQSLEQDKLIKEIAKILLGSEWKLIVILGHHKNIVSCAIGRNNFTENYFVKLSIDIKAMENIKSIEKQILGKITSGKNSFTPDVFKANQK
jgi:hypothetical protein